MAAPTPLKDTDLIDCARANAKQGIETAAQLCGYGDDLNTFKRELKLACERIGVTFNELTDLIADESVTISMEGIEVAPESKSQL